MKFQAVEEAMNILMCQADTILALPATAALSIVTSNVHRAAH